MARVVVEVNSITNIVEKIYPFRNGMPMDPEPGRYAIANVEDFTVALGFICDRNVTPPTFAPNPNPPVDEASIRQLAEEMLTSADEMKSKAAALLANIG